MDQLAHSIKMPCNPLQDGFSIQLNLLAIQIIQELVSVMELFFGGRLDILSIIVESEILSPGTYLLSPHLVLIPINYTLLNINWHCIQVNFDVCRAQSVDMTISKPG